MLKRNCIVKYVDTFGIEHSLRIEAESLFEAAIRGLQRMHSSFRGDMWGRMSITVEVYAEPTTYGVMVEKLKPWIKSEEDHPQKRSDTGEPRRPALAQFLNHFTSQTITRVQNPQRYSDKRERVQTRRATSISDPKRNL